MRTQPCLRQFPSLLAIISLLACVATASGQPVGKDGAAATAPSPAYDLEIKDGLLVWNGAKRKDNANQVQANLHNVVDLLRELHPDANFAVSPGLAETVIADLKMRTSSVEEKLEVIRIASGSEFLWRNAHATSIDPKTGLPAMPGNQPSPPLYVLDALPAQAKSGLQVEAFNISTYIKAFNTYPSPSNGKEDDPQKRLDQIERMVLETVKEYEIMSHVVNSKAKSMRSPSIKFHPGANLVIVIGEPEAVAVAAKVIGALPGALRSVASDAPGNGDPSQRMDEVLKKRLEQERMLPGPRR
jgi:hypothetical protein